MTEKYITSWCIIRKDRVIVNGHVEIITENFITFAAFIKALYKKEKVSYPKFYKMDNVSKLGFLTAELALRERKIEGRYPAFGTGVMMANSSSSLDTDIEYQETIRDKNNYFPSPAVFVYTLPNIVIGEICIRNGFKGENAFLISKGFDAEMIRRNTNLLFSEGHLNACICGWVEVLKDGWESVLMIVEEGSSLNESVEVTGNFREFSAGNINQIYTI
jgi:hypothetical protein